MNVCPTDYNVPFLGIEEGDPGVSVGRPTGRAHLCLCVCVCVYCLCLYCGCLCVFLYVYHQVWVVGAQRVTLLLSQDQVRMRGVT